MLFDTEFEPFTEQDYENCLDTYANMDRSYLRVTERGGHFDIRCCENERVILSGDSDMLNSEEQYYSYNEMITDIIERIEEEMFTVKEFLMNFVDPYGQQFRIWDNEIEDVVYEGYLHELPDRYADADVTSIDNVDKDGILTININCDD